MLSCARSGRRRARSRVLQACVRVEVESCGSGSTLSLPDPGDVESCEPGSTSSCVSPGRRRVVQARVDVESCEPELSRVV